MERSSKSGFTLIEILVVVAIIGLMTAVIAINTNAARIQSRDAKRKTDQATVAASLEVYYSEKRVYPASEGSWAANSWQTLKGKLVPTYTSSFPSDPNGTDGVFGSGFVYQTNAAGFPLPAGCTTGCVGPNADTLYAIDVTLEANDTVTNPELNNSAACTDATQLTFYTTGSFLCTGNDGKAKVHYRTSSR